MALATDSRQTAHPNAVDKRPRWLPRSLAVQLTLAFLLVGVLGAVLVAVLVGYRTRSEFDRFLSERDQETLVTALASYYQSQGSWTGVDTLLATNQQLANYSRDLTLVDATGVMIINNPAGNIGQQVDADRLSNGLPIQVNGETVGTVLLGPMRGPYPDAHPRPPEQDFLTRIAFATIASAGVAALFALLLGFLLARTLTRSIRELTAATQAMASGKLGQRVTVSSHNEIGELASSFNQMSADLAHASYLRKQMTADLAHDLRTPLSILRGYTEGLKDSRLQGTPALFSIMHGEVEHLQRLVEDLRILSLADAGELPLNRRAVDPRALLERAGLAYFVQAEQQQIAIQINAPDDLPSVFVDTDRMAQLLNNLVGNALRHTAEGAITLSALSHNQQIVLKVRDTGSGIAADDLPHIFDRFYRADKARQRTDSTSSGLGLAIAKAIVEAHSGTIAIDSTRGQGTTVSITLPAA